MEISYKRKKDAVLFCSHSNLNAKFGPELTKKIEAKIQRLEVALNLAEYAQTDSSCHELKGDRRGQIALNLTGSIRLIIDPVCQEKKPDGGLDWEKIDSVFVIEVVNYH